jgi:hypothetical protein
VAAHRPGQLGAAMGPSGPNPAARPLGPGYLPYPRPFFSSPRTVRRIAAAAGVAAVAGTGAVWVQHRAQQERHSRQQHASLAAPPGALTWLLPPLSSSSSQQHPQQQQQQQQEQGKQQPQLLLPQAVADMLCGAIGEMVSVAVLYPLDTIKVRGVAAMAAEGSRGTVMGQHCVTCSQASSMEGAAAAPDADSSGRLHGLVSHREERNTQGSSALHALGRLAISRPHVCPPPPPSLLSRRQHSDPLTCFLAAGGRFVARRLVWAWVPWCASWQPAAPCPRSPASCMQACGAHPLAPCS